MPSDSNNSPQYYYETSGAQSGKRGAVALAPAFLHAISMVLAGLAAVGYMLVEAEDDHSHLWMFASIVFQIGAMVAAGWYCRKVAKRMNRMPAVTPVLLAVMLVSYIWEGFTRLFTEHGHPFELLVMCSMKNVVLAMAAVGCWLRYQKMAALSSMFIILFTLTMKPSIAVQIIVAAYVLIGVSWLSFSYWEALRLRLLETQKAKRSYWKTGLAAVVIVGVLAGIGMTDNQVSSAIKGFMPSSGGTEHYDPFARGGVGDGDALVAASENIQSFAPIEEAPFRSSEQPSLYDVFDDTYEEPVKVKKSERAISLPPQFSQDVCKRIAKSKQANRQFSTLRQKNPKRKGHLKDLESEAIFYVAGRTPLHLRMQLYDLYDGDQWYVEEAEVTRRLKHRDVNGKPWIEYTDRYRTFDFFSKPETHALKIANLDSNRIPAPLHTMGYHIDQLELVHFFEIPQYNIVALTRDKIPEMLPIHLISRMIDHDKIPAEMTSLGRHTANSPYQVLPTIDEIRQIRVMAQAWTKDADHDWEKVEAIVNRLRSDYTLDSEEIVSEKTKSPVAEFLLKTKRGPDYQFATAAAMMLRTLGYSTRVVSGFYANPERYDSRSRHTPVLRKDVHFWAEVYVGAGMWTTIEPTPGYELLSPPPTFLDHTVEFAWLAVVWVKDNVIAIMIGLFVIAMIYWSRYAIADAWWTWNWRATRKASIRDRVLCTFDLLDKRLRWSGASRPEGSTPARWLKSQPLSFEQREQLQKLTLLVDWAAFSPSNQDTPPGLSSSEAESCCDDVIRQWTRKQIHTQLRQPQTESSTNWMSGLLTTLHPNKQLTN